MATNLQLDRSKANLLFSSWTLTRDIVKSASVTPLPGGFATQETDDYDYVHTRFSALHNHLLASGRYAFLRTADGLSLHELQTSAEQPSFAPVAVLGEAQQGLGAQTPEIEAVLPPSVAEVATTAGQLAPPGQTLLLVSTGHGDLLLMLRQAGGVALSAAVHPLRPSAPLQGVRPFFLEAAVQLPDRGHIRCVLWAVRPRSDTQPSRCEVYAATLALAAPAGAAQAQGSPGVPELQVTDVKLIRRSAMTPHGVLANPVTGALLLALEPAGDGAEEAAPDAAPGTAAQPHAEPVDDSSDPVSPRSLQAAAARLAQYTSEEPVGPLPQSQWADLYSESGPDGVGDVGQEPACTLFLYDAALSCVEQIPCLPHKVLSCQLQQDRLLLGLTDDVDCAVVEVACTANAAGLQDGLSTCGFTVQHAASVPALAYVAAGKLQRKFLLLAPPGGTLGAALVESQRYAYLYRATAARQEYGQQEVVELGLPEGSQGVLGAALVPAAGGASRLLLLTSTELRMYECS